MSDNKLGVLFNWYNTAAHQQTANLRYTAGLTFSFNYLFVTESTD